MSTGATTSPARVRRPCAWLLDEVEAWLPTGNPFTRLGQAPKHHLGDPALAARLLGVDAAALAAGAQGPSSDLRRGGLLIVAVKPICVNAATVLLRWAMPSLFMCRRF